MSRALGLGLEARARDALLPHLVSRKAVSVLSPLTR
jgi:hypothetical protein